MEGTPLLVGSSPATCSVCFVRQPWGDVVPPCYRPEKTSLLQDCRCHRGSLDLNVAIHPHAPLFSSTLRYGRRSSLYASELNGMVAPGFED